MKQKEIDKILNSFKPPKIEILLEEEDVSVCKKCKVQLYEDDEAMVCPNCFQLTPLMLVNSLEQIENENYNYYRRKNQYSRLNNFKYVLSRFQAKEDNQHITCEVIEELKKRINENSNKSKNLKIIDNLKLLIKPYLLKCKVINQLNKINHFKVNKSNKKMGNLKISDKLYLLINKKTNDELKDMLDEIKLLVCKYPYKNGVINLIKKIKTYLSPMPFNRLIIKLIEEITGTKQMRRHLYFIRYSLGLDKNNYLTFEEEEKVMTVFKIINRTINKYIPANRSNSLNSQYLMYNIFKLLGLNKFLSKLKIITTKNTLLVYNMIWAKLCEEHGLPLLPYP